MSQKPPLVKTEWDFESIPDDELEPCCHYEYAREYYRQSPLLQRIRSEGQAFENWRKQNKNCETPKELVPGRRAIRRVWRIVDWKGDKVPLDLVTFPELSWHELSQLPFPTNFPVQHGKDEAEERRSIRKLGSDRFHIETLAQLKRLKVKGIESWIHYHEHFHRGLLPATEYGFFAINWSYEPNEIRNAFNDWLEERLKERQNTPKITVPSRGGFKDRLHWLGALRLKKYYKKSELVDYPGSKLKVRVFYGHYPDLTKAAKRAERLICEMFPSEAEAERIDALPIDYESELTEKDLARFLRLCMACKGTQLDPSTAEAAEAFLRGVRVKS